MKQCTEKIDIPRYRSEILDTYLGDMPLGILDLETTGLNAEKDEIILAGLLVVSGESSMTLHQFFAESPDEEPDVIDALLSLLEELRIIVTYNGSSFDIPFLKTRMSYHHLSGKLVLPYNLDLYRVLKSYSPLRMHLPNLKQKTVEDFMGLWSERADTISGGESVDLYYDYLRSGDTSAEEKIFLHNHDDVLQLYRLLPVTKKADMHKAFYNLGFPVSNGLVVKDISMSGCFLEILGEQRETNIDYIVYESDDTPYTARFRSDDSSFHIKIPHYQSGILALGSGKNKRYAEINRLVKVVLERIMREWNTQKKQKK